MLPMIDVAAAFFLSISTFLAGEDFPVRESEGGEPGDASAEVVPIIGYADFGTHDASGDRLVLFEMNVIRVEVGPERRRECRLSSSLFYHRGVNSRRFHGRVIFRRRLRERAADPVDLSIRVTHPEDLLRLIENGGANHACLGSGSQRGRQCGPAC